jgi:SPP1 gp7 family putative phage head morphogenesis protein
LSTPALPDVTIEPMRQLPAPEKGLKAAPKLESIEQQVERVAAGLIREHYQQAARSPRAERVEQLKLSWADDWADSMRRFYPLALEKAFGDAGVTLGMSLAFTVSNPLIRETLGELVQQVKGLSETSADDIRALIGRQAEEGWSISRLTDEILKQGEIQSADRAEMIARTETAAAYSKGSLLAYKQSGVVEAVEWLAEMDDRTSPECRALHGKRRALDDAFEDGTSHPPRHPRCRCALVPIV